MILNPNVPRTRRVSGRLAQTHDEDAPCPISSGFLRGRSRRDIWRPGRSPPPSSDSSPRRGELRHPVERMESPVSRQAVGRSARVLSKTDVSVLCGAHLKAINEERWHNRVNMRNALDSVSREHFCIFSEDFINQKWIYKIVGMFIVTRANA